MTALITRRGMIAGLFAGPAIIAIDRLMPVSSRAFDFWVQYSTTRMGVPDEGDWQSGTCTYRRWLEIRPYLIKNYGGAGWTTILPPRRILGINEIGRHYHSFLRSSRELGQPVLDHIIETGIPPQLLERLHT